MKKQYIQPNTICCTIQVERVVAVSVQTNENSASVDGSGNLNNETKHDSYNVWNDDWSK